MTHLEPSGLRIHSPALPHDPEQVICPLWVPDFQSLT